MNYLRNAISYIWQAIKAKTYCTKESNLEMFGEREKQKNNIEVKKGFLFQEYLIDYHSFY